MYKNAAILADDSITAKKAKQELLAKYSFIDDSLKAENADVAIVLGGDGFMLHTMHRLIKYNVPIYGMNCGTIGFLLNEYSAKGLEQRLANTKAARLHPLEMKVVCEDGSEHLKYALNEVSLLRQTAQTAKLRVKANNQVQIEEMVCDGALVSTPAGSTAYNFSANGPVLPLNSNILALTPISCFRPRRWKGALLPSDKKIEFEVLNPEKRPVSAVADFHEIRNVVHVHISEDKNYTIHLLFDEGHTLQDRIIKEQFIL